MGGEIFGDELAGETGGANRRRCRISRTNVLVPLTSVIAIAAKQSRLPLWALDCFASLAMTVSISFRKAISRVGNAHAGAESAWMP